MKKQVVMNKRYDYYVCVCDGTCTGPEDCVPTVKSQMEKPIKKTCYYCHIDKNTVEMQQIVVWFCNDCLEKSKISDKKKKQYGMY